jgi:uncharacterized protein (TIGR03790 family)
MRLILRSLCLALLTLPGASLLQGDEVTPHPLADRVVVVANKRLPESAKLARFYMEKRGIPENHLILLDTATGETISREDFNTSLRNPLLRELRERSLIEALEGQTDDFGRDTVILIDTKIRYLVTLYGIPVHITEASVEETDDTELRTAAFSRTQPNLVEAFTSGPMARNEAAVDSELALLLRRDIPMVGFFPNPLFGKSNLAMTENILRVCRLDGPSPRAVRGMINHALEGERFGLKGRAYVDEDTRQGGFAQGNNWLRETAQTFARMGYDLTHDRAKSTIPPDERIDQPVLYAGWYEWNINAPFTHPGFRFPAGAIAAHLHSFSARPLRSKDKGWAGPFIERGVSATFGNTAEPYLSLTHRFNMFFAALAQGTLFGDAAYFAMPALSWQGIFLGDPLYHPFRASVDDQLAEAGEHLDQLLDDQYVFIRKARLLEAEGDTATALRTVRKGMRETPGPALALYHSQLLLDLEQPEEALRALKPVASWEPARAWSGV